jgi:hypothetical protein
VRNIWKYKPVKTIIGILIPATLGFYQSKLNNIEAVLKYAEIIPENELINTGIFQDIMLLEIIGYITFFITIGLFSRFVWVDSYYKSKKN